MMMKRVACLLYTIIIPPVFEGKGVFAGIPYPLLSPYHYSDSILLLII